MSPSELRDMTTIDFASMDKWEFVVAVLAIYLVVISITGLIRLSGALSNEPLSETYKMVGISLFIAVILFVANAFLVNMPMP